MNGLVLSLFPGIGLLDMAFEAEGFCVVRGPNVLWGGDVRTFHPPAGRFDGVIGGPPCQMFSRLRHLNPRAGSKHGNLIPEYERVVAKAEPTWFVMENVPDAPSPEVVGYHVHRLVLNNRQLGEVQNRTRAFSFGTRDGRRLMPRVAVFEAIEYRNAVTSSLRAVPVKLNANGKPKRTYTDEGKRRGPDCGPRAAWSEMCRLQGVAPGFLDECPFTESAKRKMLGNGVPLPMGRAIARAVAEALARTEAA